MRGPESPVRMGNFGGKDMPTDSSPFTAANALVRIRRSGGIITRRGRMHSLQQGWRGWQMQFNRLCVAAMRPFVKLLWPLVVLHTFQIINAGQKCHKNVNMYDRSKATFPVYCHPKCLSSQHSTYTFRSWKSFLSGYWHRTVHPSGSISGERKDKISWVIPLADNRKNVQPLKLSHGSIITDQDG